MNDQIFSSKTSSIEVVVESIKFLLWQCLKAKKTTTPYIMNGSHLCWIVFLDHSRSMAKNLFFIGV